jgi:UDP-glucose 4-epimerase
MRLLVTGCHGFIGGTLGCLGSDLRGYEVIGVGRRASQPEAWLGRYVQADLDGPRWREIVEETRPDVILHAAGPSSVRASLEDPLADFRDSTACWAGTLDGVRRSGLQPLLVFISSAAVYGNPQSLPVGEDASIAPISPYGFHKAACELLSESTALCFGHDVLTLRCFSLFGERQRRLLVWELYEQLAGSNPTVWLAGTGEESRDYLSVGDLEEALSQLVEQRSALTGHVILNVGRGVETAVGRLADEMRAFVAPGKSIRAKGGSRPGDPLHWCADVSKLRGLIPGWQPRPLSTTLEECLAHWQEQRSRAEVA